MQKFLTLHLVYLGCKNTKSKQRTDIQKLEFSMNTPTNKIFNKNVYIDKVG